MTQKNPLLSPISSLIDYSAVRPDHIEPAITALIDDARKAVDRSADAGLPASWETVVEPLEDASETLWRAWSVAGHLNAVVNTPELRTAGRKSGVSGKSGAERVDHGGLLSIKKKK